MRLLAIDPSGYRPHPLHASERTWTETNCYVDLWIELLHALDLDPLAAAAFTISTDFEGDQWTFFKFPPEDLRALFGLEVAEFNVWRPVLDHAEEQLELGRLLIMDADAWFLPDTQGVSYQLAHVKSAMVPNSIDRAGAVSGTSTMRATSSSRATISTASSAWAATRTRACCPLCRDRPARPDAP